MVQGKRPFLGYPEKLGGGLAVSAGLTSKATDTETVIALLLSVCFLLRYNIPSGRKDWLHSFA